VCSETNETERNGVAANRKKDASSFGLSSERQKELPPDSSQVDLN
jgi:hypothetical protein